MSAHCPRCSQTFREFADWENHVCQPQGDRRAAPKIESAEAPGADVRRIAKWLREWSDHDVKQHGPREAMAMNMEATLGYIAARMLESLSTRCTALEAELNRSKLSADGTEMFYASLNAAGTRAREDMERITALEGVIAEHNKRCERECGYRSANRGCQPDEETGVCDDCPRKERIPLQSLSDGAK